MPGKPEVRANDHRLAGPNFVIALARSKPIAGMDGRMYPGSFDREIVKNTRQNPAQLKLARRTGVAGRGVACRRIDLDVAQKTVEEAGGIHHAGPLHFL